MCLSFPIRNDTSSLSCIAFTWLSFTMFIPAPVSMSILRKLPSGFRNRIISSSLLKVQLIRILGYPCNLLLRLSFD